MAALSQGGKSKQKQRQEKGKKFHGKGVLVLLKNRILTYTKRIANKNVKDYLPAEIFKFVLQHQKVFFTSG
jgi:hypothetical protein